MLLHFLDYSTPGTPEASTSTPPACYVSDVEPRNETLNTTCANPKCPATFTPGRKDQRYCSRPCQRAATRHSARGSRQTEHRQRSQRHYERAAWLSYDLNRMPPARRRAMLLALLEAAAGGDAPLRNILLDPRLLGADRASRIGKLYPDTRSRDALNIAKMAYVFCMEEWGCSTRDAIMDRHTLDGPWTPAYRTFREEDGDAAARRSDAIRPPHVNNEPEEEPLPEYVKRDPASFLALIRRLRAGETTTRAA